MRRQRDSGFGEDGFEKWGGYMNAKVAKLEDQYKERVVHEENKSSDIFNGISIFVNGYTKPSADQLKCLMAEHGGVYHHYFRPGRTKFIIASNLPDTKVKNLPTTKIIKPEWVSDSIEAGMLLDYKKYILYSNQSKTQPSLNFGNLQKLETSSMSDEKSVLDSDKTKLKESALQRTAVDPQFLFEFYNNSRLHHISQLGATFKDYVNELRNMSDFAFPLRQKLKKSTHEGRIEENPTTIMHIDMDCFFVSVGLRKYPHLKGQPVAVTHAKTGKGKNTNHQDRDSKSNFTGGSMSEIASCSYEARKMGLKNGMFMGPALRLCPNLKTISYDFEDYKEVAFQLYNTIAQYTLDIEAVSCDEMYVDCTELLSDIGLTPLEFASEIRAEIKQKTMCTCSTGFGENRLQARMATKKAKPDGQFCLMHHEAELFFSEIPLRELPGVGRQMQKKMEELGFSTCGSLQKETLKKLQKDFGMKTGELLYNYCRGKDSRPLNFKTVRKSVSAAANYGIRFTEEKHCEDFLIQLCKELQSRMVKNKVVGKAVTLKVMVRSMDAPVETAKFMGHGMCDNITKTSNFSTATDDLDLITKEVIKMAKKLQKKPEDWRGVGIQVSKLTSTDSLRDNKTTGIQQFFGNKIVENSSERPTPSGNTLDMGTKDSESDNLVDNNRNKEERNVSLKRRRGRPPKRRLFENDGPKSKSTIDNCAPNLNYDVSDIDLEVLKALPSDIQMEILNQYKSINKMPTKEISRVVEEATTSVEFNAPTNLKSDSPTGLLNLRWQDIRNMLKIWMKSDSPPLECDVMLIIMYLQNLVAERKIEDVYSLLNFAYRTALELGQCDWHKVYLRFVSNIQKSMMMVYGKKMFIMKTFDCCNSE